MLKKYVTRSNIISIALMGFLIWRQGPEWMNNQKSQGVIITPQEYSVYGLETKKIKFPSQHSKVLTIFWASWCEPCKLEMSRLEKSVKSGKIKTDQIIAINPFEEPEVAAKFLKNNSYPFTFIHAPEVAKLLNVTATPTTLFVDKGVVTNRSSGISTIGIWRAEFFLN